MNAKPYGQSSQPSPSNPLDQYLKPSGATGSKPSTAAPPSGGVTTDPEPAARMIDFVAKSGKRTGLPYAYLVSVTLEGNETCELTFTEQVVSIRGRNVGALYQHALAGTLRVVVESGSGFDPGSGECWVETLTIQPRSSR